MSKDVDAAGLARHIEQPTARGIALSLTALIRSGELAGGSRLPTVRALAAELGVSPATVAEAWGTLRRRRAIATGRRRGTVVLGPPPIPRPRRFERVGNFGSRLGIDLTWAVPDPALLPPLDAALRAALDDNELNDYRRPPITDRLAEAMAATWPFPTEHLLAVGGGYEGVHLICQTTVEPGDRVAVEQPTAPRVLDILDSVGADLVPVACDQRGPVPDALAEALAHDPVAFVYQPRTQSPCGHSLTRARARELVAVLRHGTALVVEDDGLGDLSQAPNLSLGSWLPTRTVLIRSLSKPYGPDLRLAVVGGAADAIERARVRRSFGTGWTSRILQDAAAFLMTDPATQETVSRAQETYRHRREALAAPLATLGVRTHNEDGLCLWVPVADERHALVTLAAHGISASPGSRFEVRPGAPHVRVGTGRLSDSFDDVAQALALAAADDRE
jgi:DNA-binding transcriptional MocR family regulator